MPNREDVGNRGSDAREPAAVARDARLRRDRGAAISRPYRYVLPIWLWVVLAVIGVLLPWTRWADFGDRGMNNAATTLLSVLGTLIATFWFVLVSRYSRRLRFGMLGIAVLAVAGFLLLFRFEGFTGSMAPRFGWRVGARTDADLPVPEDALRSGAAEVDLRSTTPHDFPGFLGPGRDLRVEGVELGRDWESSPPELLWRQEIGAGWSAFAIVNGVAVTMEQRGEDELVTAYDLMSGRLLWAHAIGGRFTHPLGGPGPRATPTIDAGRVYALGAQGRLVCLEGATGRLLWEHDLLEEYGVTLEQEVANVQYGRANSPLVVGDLVVVPAGGNPSRPPVSLVAYDKRSGEMVWEGGSTQISFSSPRLATLAGVEQILILNEDTASGHDPASGRVLWEHPWPGTTSADATASQAVPVPPDRVFMSKGYGGGASLVRLVPRGDGTFESREVWKSSRVLRTKLTNVVVDDGHVYGLSDGILECVDVETGERVWKHGRYGHGQILKVGELLLVLTEDGELVLLDPSPQRPDDVLGRFQALDGKTWNNIALYGPYVAIRNAQEAAVYRLPLAEGP